MSNSVMPAGEDAAWAQTFITVTPQDDGFLRELEENVVVSGSADTTLDLNTWNIVLRQSLMNTTKDLMDPTELEQSRRIETECQTYLQGVPEVELPLVYRNEATQTLYMGRDQLGAGTPQDYFNGIITVLNEKSMPELKTSHEVQTSITMKDGASEDDVIRMLMSSEYKILPNDSENPQNATLEASDILNFIVERTLWITESMSVPKREKNNATAQTSIKYNPWTKKVAIDYETQTKLTCEPKHSDSMLLVDYKQTKNFCRARVSECLEKGVYPRIVIDNIVEEIMFKCKSQTNFSFEEKLPSDVEEKETRLGMEQRGQQQLRPIRCICRINNEVDRIIKPIRNILPKSAFEEKLPSDDEKKEIRRHQQQLPQNGSQSLELSWRSSAQTSSSGSCAPTLYTERRTRQPTVMKCCGQISRSRIVSTSGSSNGSQSLESPRRCSAQTSSSGSSAQTSSSERSLKSQDKQALGILKNAFCNR